MKVEHTEDLEVELTLKRIPIRDRETDEETTAWSVDHPAMERACRGDTPREALDIFGACCEDDAAPEVSIDLEDLAEADTGDNWE